MAVRIMMAAAAIVGVARTGLALDIPLTVRETENVARAGNPVNSGVPLPVGAVKDAGGLRLLDADGRPVLASIEPRCRWLADGSLKWVTVHFLADVPAGGSRTYTLTTRPQPAAGNPISVEKKAGSIVVTTGPARFVVPTERLGPFAQVQVRADPSKPFAEADALLSGPAAVRLAGRNGQMRVVDGKAELVGLEAPFEQTARVTAARVEESGPGRAVVALEGTFSTPQAESLDFTARLYFYAGSPLAQMTLSVRNRQMKSMARFVGVERLAVEVPLAGGEGGAKYVLPVDGKPVAGTLSGKGAVTLLQSARDKLVVTGPDGGGTKGNKSAGWVRLSTGRGTLTAGNRWFWQTYPKGLTVRADGTVALELAPRGGARVDLFNAGAKTHFLFFHFAKADAPAPQSIAAGTTHPLVAACEPGWYCQRTRVMGDLYANDPQLFAPEHRDLVARFQANVDRCVRQIVRQRPRADWPFGVDEYGWLDFGSGLHHRSRTTRDSATSWWDGNYYDFPHAVILNYLRTGDVLNLRTAEEAGLHLADIDICHSFPGDPKQAGSPRSGPVIGHFRDYTRQRAYLGHNSFTFYKNESLYELYYLTGERWYHDVGRMSSDFAMARWGQGALRNVSHGIWGVLSAYHDTHDRKYLERARFFVDKWAKPWQDKHDGSFDDQLWMYGLQFEAYHKYFLVTGDRDTARYNLRAVDALLAEGRRDPRGRNGIYPITLVGFGLAYEYTGDRKYFQTGMTALEKAARVGATRVKTFAQCFRASPYFLKYLTVGYKPEPILAK
jgi:hypothetical protein